MAEPITQKNRIMSAKFSALAEDTLCVDRASITERVSHPFGMQLELLADLNKEGSIKHDQIVGKHVTLTVELPDKKKRFFNGMVSRFSAGGRDDRFLYYRAEVVPWLWLLTLTSDCKIFQDKTIPDIIEEVFKEWQGKFSDLVKFENKLQGTYKKVDYCVQYRETDFNFVSRLIEQEGMFYFFKHEDGKHTLVLGDKDSAFEACPNMEKARFLPEAGMAERQDGVLSYEYRHSMVPGRYELGDWHFMMSEKGPIKQSEDGAVSIGNNSSLEIYDYPGEYAQRFVEPDERMGEVEPQGKDLAKWRMQEQALAHLQISGNASARAFTAGCHFSLLGKNEAQIKVPGTQGKYVLTSVKHSIIQEPDYISGATTTQPYRNTFSCVPLEVPYRPARSTPRPVIQGVQTAVVVDKEGKVEGKAQEEIDCDKYGRVKVRFHWDRSEESKPTSSCWVRVATLWAGKNWGTIHIPRIGQEVVVSFLEGDPDQPLIVGSVYNHDHMPPWELDKEKTQSGIKTNSTKKGETDKHYNEISFEDKKGEELLYVRAEKNLTKAVENDETVWVGNDRYEEVDNNEEVIVDKGNRTVTLKQGNDKHHLEMGNREVLLDMGNDKHHLKMGNREVFVDMGNDALTVKMGNQTTKLNLGKSETDAMQSIELKVGQSSLKVDQTGVTIKGMMIKIEGTMMTQVKGLMNQVNADAILTVKGGLTMIG
jgi:type VI secretion system secreted protein VgrG